MFLTFPLDGSYFCPNNELPPTSDLWPTFFAFSHEPVLFLFSKLAVMAWHVYVYVSFFSVPVHVCISLSLCLPYCMLSLPLLLLMTWFVVDDMIFLHMSLNSYFWLTHTCTYLRTYACMHTHTYHFSQCSGPRKPSWLAILSVCGSKYFPVCPRREAGDVWCLPPVWNLRAVIWFHFAISSLVLLPSPVTLSVLSFSARLPFLLSFLQKIQYF